MANRKKPHYVGLRPDVEEKVEELAAKYRASVSQVLGWLIEAGLYAGIEAVWQVPTAQEEEKM